MRVYIKSTATFSRDASLENNIYDNRDEPYILDDSNPGPSQGSTVQLVVAAVGVGGTYVRAGLNGIGAKYLIIETDSAINILLNSSSADPTNKTPIPLVPLQVQVPAPTPGQLVPPQKAKMELSGTGLTAGLDIWIQNPAQVGASPANVTIVVAG